MLEVGKAANGGDAGFEPVITDFPNQAKGIKFKKETLIDELLSLGHAKITPQIARMVGDEVEKEIHKRKIEFLSTELISELVEGRLEELGLIRSRRYSTSSVAEKEDHGTVSLVKARQELLPEVLEVLAPSNDAPPKGGGTSEKIKPEFADESLEILRRHFLIKNEEGEIVESPEELLGRVARTIAACDIKYSPSINLKNIETEFFNLMAGGHFLPAPAVLKNAGRALGFLSSCTVLPINDSMESIFETMKETAIIHKCGGSTGFSFSTLRPRHDNVHSTHGFSSGPVSFIRVYHAATQAVRDGSEKSGLSRAFLRIDHPDILEFLSLAESAEKMPHFHFSVGLTGNFIKAFESNSFYDLINPRSGEPVRKLKATKVFGDMARCLVRSGTPSFFYCDRIEAGNPTPLQGQYKALDPCSGQPFLDFEPCHYGAINLAKIVKNKKIDWEQLRRTVQSAVHFLDNVIEANHYPLPEIEEAARKNRKIGLSVMGWGDLLVLLGLSYHSPEAETLAEQLMSFVNREAQNASLELAKKRGTYPAFEESIYADRGTKRRHAVLTAIVDDPLLAGVAGCSTGIHPLSALVSEIKIGKESTTIKIHPEFESWLKQEGLFSEKIIDHLLKKGSLEEMIEWPREVRELFVTTRQISPECHLKIQAAFQRHTENAVIQKIPLAGETSEEELGHWMTLGYDLGLKGIIFEPQNREGEANKPGDEKGTLLEAISRLITLALRSGVEGEMIATAVTGALEEKKG